MKTTPDASEVGNLIADLLQTAVRTDGKGQLNISKVLRASATAIARTAAEARGFPTDTAALVNDLTNLADRLRKIGINTVTCDSVALGAELVHRGEMSYVERFPDPYVCRRCGFMTASGPTESCPECGAHELTFEHFGPVYWLTLYDPPEVLDRLETNPLLFDDAIQQLDPDRLAWRSSENSWSAIDVLRHVRDADSVLARRLKLMLDEENPALAFQAVFAWTDERRDKDASMQSVVESYRSTRQKTVSLLRLIPPDAWWRTGQHEEFGQVTVLQQASYFAAHELTHLRQLEQLRRAF